MRGDTIFGTLRGQVPNERGDAVATVPMEVPVLHRPPGSDVELIDRVDQSLEVLQGKWKVHLLFYMARGIHRHSRLLACLPGVSKKVMTDSLRVLERDGLVHREIFAEVPVRVEYSLTALGWSMAEPLVALAEWGEAHGKDVAEARTRARESNNSAAA